MKKVITFGETMMRLSPPDHLRFSQTNSFDIVFGGAESNVAISLANFGIPTEFISRLPDNDLGQRVIMELRKHGVGTDYIIRGGQRLGLYFLEKGAVNRGGKVIYDRANSAISEIEQDMIDWEKVFADARWFHWSGITPAISQQAADVCLDAINAANELGITISTDLNYRSKLWNYGKKPSEVMPELVKKCDVILGGSYASEKYFGIETNSDSSEEEVYRNTCKKLMERFPKAEKIVTSLRGSISASHNSWSGALYNGKKFIEAPTYQITHIVDRVGGGDSFMGGLIYGLLTYETDQEALNFATAASCLKHTIPGDVNLATVEEVEALMEGDESGRVAR
jgi:2-dehydro-3-deoxygluconokinase